MTEPEFLPPRFPPGATPAGPVPPDTGPDGLARSGAVPPATVAHPAGETGGDTPPSFTAARYRLHWGTAVLHGAGATLVLLAVLIPLLVGAGGDVYAVFTLLMIPTTVAIFAVCFLSWRARRFWVDGDDLLQVTGVWRKRSRRVPLSRLQAVDVLRPLIPRVFGLAEVRLEVAGGDRGDVSLAYLNAAVAGRLRTALLAYAAGLPGRTPAAQERRLLRIGPGTLLASLVLRLPVLGAALLAVFLLAIGWAGHEPGVLGGLVPVALSMVRSVVMPLGAHARFSAALAADGLRLRGGVLGTRMQTVPPGRIHAVRVVEPVLWRRFGWVRLDATVAGYAGARQMASATLLPVAPRAVVVAVIGAIFPGCDVSTIPMRYGIGADDVVFAGRAEWPVRRLDVVAHTRVQSVQLAAGPWQRLRGKATVYLDTPPGPVRVRAGVPLHLARAIVDREATLAGRARDVAGHPEHWALGGR